MPTGVQTQTNVPPDQLQTVVNGFKAQGASVVTQKQDNDNYTVIATFPDPGTTSTGPEAVAPE